METALLSASAAFNLPVDQAVASGAFAPLLAVTLGLLAISVGLLAHDALRPWPLGGRPRGEVPRSSSAPRARGFGEPRAETATA